MVERRTRGKRKLYALIAILAGFVVLGYGIFLWFDFSAAPHLVRPHNVPPRVYPRPPPSLDHHLRIDVGPPTATLDVWIFEAERRAIPPGNAVSTVVVLHGIADSKSSMRGLGESFAKMGIQTVLVDLRGHGASSGTHVSFGVHESRDLVQLMDELKERELAPAPVGVYGPSYGGAVAIQWAARDRRVARVVTVGAFATMRREIIAYYDNSFMGAYLIPDFIIERITTEAGRIAGFDPDEASPLGCIAEVQARVVLIHGEADTIVPFDHGQDLATACGPHCRFVPLRGLDHMESLTNSIVRREMIAALTE